MMFSMHGVQVRKLINIDSSSMIADLDSSSDDGGSSDYVANGQWLLLCIPIVNLHSCDQRRREHVKW